jgi:hypothetical protein
LCRAVDSTGQAFGLMLSAKRDVSAAERFFKKIMRADRRRLPFTSGTGKHAPYPEACVTSAEEKVLPADCKLRRVKYLNNVIGRDHRAIRRRWRAMQCFRSLTRKRTTPRVTRPPTPSSLMTSFVSRVACMRLSGGVPRPLRSVSFFPQFQNKFFDLLAASIGKPLVLARNLESAFLQDSDGGVLSLAARA